MNKNPSTVSGEAAAFRSPACVHSRFVCLARTARMAVVFVYGTLTDPDRVSTVLDRYRIGPAAVCEGLQRVDGQYPTLAPGGQTEGRLIATAELDALDSYEGIDQGLYCRVSVPLSAENGCTPEPPFATDTIELYVGSPRLLGVEDRIEWPTSGALDYQVTQYIESNPVRVRFDLH